MIHFMRYLEQADSWRQKTGRVSHELSKQENGEIPFNGYRVSVWGDD